MSTHGHDAAPQSFFLKYCWSTDHKVIGIQYLFTGMAMALIGGFTVYVFRMQLAFPGMSVPLFGRVSAADYNALVTIHGSIMIFWVAMPVLIAAFGNFLIPLMIGCDDMVFPRVNRLSYQIFLISALLLIASFFVPGGPFGGAWTAYPPLSANSVYNLTPAGATMWLVAVALEFVAFLLGGINFITTTMNSRAPGMKMFDVPIIVWMIVLASILFMASVGPLIAGAIMLLFDQLLGTGFFNPASGGDPLLWEHLFWFFGHPEVYVVLLPAMGIVADVMVVFSRKKLFAYRTVIYTAMATGIISFFVWAHHQFIAGHRPAHGEPVQRDDPDHLGPDRRNGVRLHRDALRRLDSPDDADALGAGLHRGVPHRRRDGHLPGRGRRRRVLARHVLRDRPLPLHVLAHRHHRRLLRADLLVPEDVRPDAERDGSARSTSGARSSASTSCSCRCSCPAPPASTAGCTTTGCSPSCRRPAWSTCGSSRRWAC